MLILRGLPRGVAAIADVVDTMARDMATRVSPFLEPKTMQGACGAVSRALAKAINDHGLGWAVVEGVFNPIGGHAWVLVNDRFILDLTHTQFRRDAPRVYAIAADKTARNNFLEKITHRPCGEVVPHVLRGNAALRRFAQFAIKPKAFEEINWRLRGLT